MSWDKSRPNGKGYVAPKYRTKEHRLKKREYEALRDAGNAHCWRCGGWIPPGAPMHTGHLDDGVTYAGPEHARCGVVAAAKVARAKQTPKPRAPRSWLR